MRIISRWPDYYDGVQSYGQDERILYHRVARSVDVQQDKLLRSWFMLDDRLTYNQLHVYHPSATREGITGFIVGVGGIVHPGIALYFGCEPTFIYSMEQFWEEMSRRELTHSTFLDSLGDNHFNVYKYNRSDRGARWIKSFEEWLKPKPTPPDFTKWCVDNKAPIVGICPDNRKVEFFYVEDDFKRIREVLGTYRTEAKLYTNVLSDDRAVINPCLKRVEFFRCKDAYTVYQELDMFISGVLGEPGVPMVEITDKDRIKQHGFDEWSFRKIGKNSKVKP